MTAGGTFAFPASGLLDVRGAQNGGGAIYVTTKGPMTFGGTMDARTSNNGRGDSISLDIGGDVTMTGAMRVSGKATNSLNGQVDFEFCRLTMNAGAVIENTGGSTKNILRARERMTVPQGASITADATTGLNRFIYRDAAKPPVINGTVSPAAAADDVDSFLPGCPVCGNGELDGGETCEDGNTDNGDGCNAQCQTRAASPRRPAIRACRFATTPTAAHKTSVNRATASTLRPATTASIHRRQLQPAERMYARRQRCVLRGHQPVHERHLQRGERGCVLVNNADVCDDGLICTDGDRCNGGICAGVDICPQGQTCSADSNQCEIGGICGDGTVDGTEQCDDGDTTWVRVSRATRVASCSYAAIPTPGTVRASDALFVLRVAVGVSQRDPCICNVDSNATGTAVTASDALRVLRASVGVSVEPVCPPCA